MKVVDVRVVIHDDDQAFGLVAGVSYIPSGHARVAGAVHLITDGFGRSIPSGKPLVFVMNTDLHPEITRLLKEGS